MKPAAFASSKVEPTTGGLFQSPSSSTASSVLPRFHPGFKAATKDEAEIDLKIPVHVTPLVGVAEGLMDVVRVELGAGVRQ